MKHTATLLVLAVSFALIVKVIPLATRSHPSVPIPEEIFQRSGSANNDTRYQHSGNGISQQHLRRMLTAKSSKETATSGGGQNESLCLGAAMWTSYRRVLAFMDQFSPDEPKPRRVAYYATHQTGSATMHALLSMMAVTHKLKPIHTVLTQPRTFEHAGCAELLQVGNVFGRDQPVARPGWAEFVGMVVTPYGRVV